MPRFMGFVRMEEGVGTPPQALFDAMDAHIGERAAKGVFLDGGGLYGTEDAARALAVLTRDGTPVSSAVRAALIDAARERARSALRAEAEALANEQDRAEAAQVLRDMESLRAW